jgi:hypothetical protein
MKRVWAGVRIPYLDGISEAGLGANLSQDVECCILHLKAFSGSPELDYLDLETKTVLKQIRKREQTEYI